MIRQNEITEATQPRTRRGVLDLDAIVCTYTVTTQQTFEGIDGAGEALYTTEITDVTLLSLTLRFGEHPVADSVVMMACELTEDRRAAVEEQIKRRLLEDK
jgi:hypothetical protein